MPPPPLPLPLRLARPAHLAAAPAAFAAALVWAALLTSIAPTPARASAVFIEPDAIDLASVLPPPPEDDSLAGRADLETVLRLQADRTPEQLERVVRVANQNVFTFAAPVLGEWFNAQNLPRTALYFEIVTAESYGVALQTKRLWTRDRPHLRDARIEPVPRRSRSASYPSGHASDAATWAVLLGELFPEHRAAFEAQVHEAMWGRVLGGSHYPTDVQAGKILGDLIGRRMLASPTMQAALEVMRGELAPFRPPGSLPPATVAAEVAAGPGP